MSESKCIIKNKKYEYLDETERKKIEKRLKNGASVSEIAEGLCRHKTTIKREINRGTTTLNKQNPSNRKSIECPAYIEYNVYRFEVGERVYKEHRQNCRHKSKIESCKELLAFVIDMILNDKWSPDAAIGYAKANNLFIGQSFCTKTFYNWVEKGILRVKSGDLLRKVYMKPRKASDGDGKCNKKAGKSIEERPSEVEVREEFGHWEGDLIVGKDNKGYLFSLVERKLRIGFLFIFPNKKSKHVVNTLNYLESKYGKNLFRKIFKSITFDNGNEFSDSIGMVSDGRIIVYYAHPYSSYERGSNENWNGFVRRFLPKGSNFEVLKEDTLKKIEDCINNMPRKLLGYKTPMELWTAEIEAIISA